MLWMFMLVIAVASLAYGYRGYPRKGMVAGAAVWMIVATVTMIIFDWSLGLIISGLLVAALAALGPYLLGRYVRHRDGYREAGWELAETLERERLATAREARAAERARIATEMHDTLGHEMTLIAVQAGVLEIGAGEDAELRHGLGELRQAAAGATDRLHEIVQILTQDQPLTPYDDDLDQLIGRAAAAGMDIDSVIDVDRPLEPLAQRAVHRLVEEGLTNAGRYAPGSAVRVVVRRQADQLVATVTDAGAATASPRGAGTGRGLVSLEERFRVLGGSLQSGPTGSGFQITGTVPDHPHQQLSEPGRHSEESAEARDEARKRQRRSFQQAVLLPLALVLSAALVAGSYFVFNTVVSVLPPERFDRLQAGMSQRDAERLLPPVQMLDAPDSVQPTSDCRYYESAVSFFDRRDVFQICFSDGRVWTTTTIPAPR